MLRIHTWLTFTFALAMVIACGKVQVDSDAAPDDPDAAVGEQCVSGETECAGVCVDTESSHANCGGCGNACDGAEVCDQGDCVSDCSGDLTACNGSCVDTETNDDYCGVCTNACTSDQVCQAGNCDDLSTVATLEITSQWEDPTGWLTPAGQAIAMTFTDPGVAGVVIECRTGPESMIGGMPFSPCDGAAGTGTSYRPSPVASVPEGSYRTDVRLRRGAWMSPVQSHEFYVHRSLDSVKACPRTFTDAQIFAKAASELNSAPTFDPATVARRPFIHIPFKNITVDFSLKSDGTRRWDNINTGASWDADVLALRRRFALSADNRLLVVHRAYESRMQKREYNASSCANRFSFGHRAKHPCPFLVLNSRGEGVCLAPDPTNGANLINTRGPGQWFSNGWLKLKRRDDYHKAFYGKRTTPCPAGGCEDWEISLPQ